MDGCIVIYIYILDHQYYLLSKSLYYYIFFLANLPTSNNFSVFEIENYLKELKNYSNLYHDMLYKYQV